MLDDFRNKIKALQEFDIAAETVEILNENHQVLESMLRSQLSKGKDGNNDNVTIRGSDIYRDSTVQNKRYNGVGLGAETDFITNYMTGEFYASLKLKSSGTTFEIDSPVPYFSDIIRQSGTVIMELNQENLNLFAQEILFPELNKRFSQKFNS